MVEIFLIGIFVFGYTAVALEHHIKINKAATVLIMAVLSWMILAGQHVRLRDISETVSAFGRHLQDIAQIIIFLLGAMTIVAAIEAHHGFKIVIDLIRTKNKRVLLWIVSFITFFLSAVLDNLTTSIVMVALLPRLLDDRADRLIFASMIIVAANAGGAWTPIGDVTTTMLWIGERISSFRIMKMLFIPSLVSVLVPLIYFTFSLNHEPAATHLRHTQGVRGGTLIFFLGIGALIAVPVIRALTYLPPFIGVLLGLGILWVILDRIHPHEEELRIPHILSKIDLASILFFLGILLTVASLEVSGILQHCAAWLDTTIGNKDIIGTILGLLSAIVDNVPLTAATMGMYSLNAFPTDSKIWELLAFAAGTGGSILIIGSAAGVVVMGIEKITFTWYLRKISLPVLIGYLAGILSYSAIYAFFGG